jgi:hypothetical protein
VIFQLRILTCISQAPVCNCNAIITAAIKKIETNYIDRDRLSKSQKYLRVKEMIPTENKDISDAECTVILAELVSSINDKHLNIFNENFRDSGYKPHNYKDSEFLRKAEMEYYSMGKSSGIEGIWYTTNNDYKLLILRSNLPRRYEAVVLESSNSKWKRGDIKAFVIRRKNSYAIRFIQGNFTEIYFKAIWKDTLFVTGPIGSWRRTPYPQSNSLPITKPELSVDREKNTAIFKIPSFVSTKNIIDSLLYSYKDELKQISHLIIDVRNNTGGSTSSYKGLLSYLYTNPLKSEDAYFISSSDNIEALGNTQKRIKDTASQDYKSYSILLGRMKKSPGEKVLDSGSVYYQDSVLKNPRRISVIVNEKCLSAAEFFLIACKQSKKVTIYGESNTGGAGDNLDAYPFSLDCKNYVVRIPISQRIGQVYKPKIDNIGIPPDVIIPSGEDPYLFILSKK